MSTYDRRPGTPASELGGEPLPPVGTIEIYDPPPPPRRKRNWLIAGGALVVVALIAAIGVFVVLSTSPATGLGATAGGYAYLPDNAAMAVEARLDLPAGQREEVVIFLSRFPQFADVTEVERRLDEVLDEAIATATGGRGSYETDVEPWFAGWVVAGGRLPPMDAGVQPSDNGSFVGVLGSTDRGEAEAAMERLRPGESWTSQAGPEGVTIWVGDARFDDTGNVYAVTDDAVVLGGSVQDVERAIERKRGDAPNLLDTARFRDAMASQPEGRVAAFWLDYEAFSGAMSGLPGTVLGAPLGIDCPGGPQPRTMVGSVYVRDGRGQMDVAIEMAEDAELPQLRDSGLAARVPADSLFFLDMRDLGTSVTRGLECLREHEMFGQYLLAVEEQIGQPLDQLFGWAGDTAVGLRYDGSRVSGGLVVKVTDETRAAEAMGQLRALLTATGGPFGESVEVREEEYGGARMVIFESDALGPVGEPPLPSASLAYAFVGELLVIGVDQSFTRAVIDTAAGNSLGTKPEYRRAVEAAGGFNNSGVVYVDFVAVESLVNSLLGASDGPLDGSLGELRDALGALESLAFVGAVDGQTVVSRLVLTTREP